MIYAQLYSHDLYNNLSEHLGSDGVIALDDRKSYSQLHEWMEKQGFTPKILAYQLRSTADHLYTPYRAVSQIKLHPNYSVKQE